MIPDEWTHFFCQKLIVEHHFEQLIWRTRTKSDINLLIYQNVNNSLTYPHVISVNLFCHYIESVFLFILQTWPWILQLIVNQIGDFYFRKSRFGLCNSSTLLSVTIEAILFLEFKWPSRILITFVNQRTFS